MSYNVYNLNMTNNNNCYANNCNNKLTDYAAVLVSSWLCLMVHTLLVALEVVGVKDITLPVARRCLYYHRALRCRPERLPFHRVLLRSLALRGQTGQSSPRQGQESLTPRGHNTYQLQGPEKPLHKDLSKVPVLVRASL